ncbi:MAG: acyltransferase [Alteraurantiacibacter sp.]
MADQGFINRPMSIALDAVRGVAALVVLLGHTVQHRIYTGPWPFSDILQHQAVVVFFVLSGLVIANSVYQRQASLADYAVARVARIMPVALFAVLFSVAAWAVGAWFELTVIEAPRRFLDPSVAGAVLPLLFLSEAEWGTGLLWNAPYWSLVHEVWYYAFFGVACYLSGWKRAAMLALLIPLAGIRVLVLFPVWLCGAALARYAPAKAVNELTGVLCIFAGVAGLSLAHHFQLDWAPLLDELARPLSANLYLARYAITDTIFGAGVALGFLGLRALADQRAELLDRFERPIRWLAECSFTLYLIHWPILNLLHGFGVSVGSSVWLLIGLLALIVAFCGQVAKLTEHRRGDVRRWLQARLPIGWASPVAAPHPL